MLTELLRALFSRRPRPAAAPGALYRGVVALLEGDQVDEAVAAAAGAVARDPRSYEARLALGLAWQKAHEPERALGCYAAAEALRRGDPELHDLRGAALQELGRLEEAVAEFERALALEPGFARAEFHRALALLLAGDFARGWEGYELRRADPAHGARPARLPPWDGAPLAARSLLVTREQGLGDEIMFASMLPEVVAAAGRCFVECEARLAGLFARSFPAATVFASPPDGGLPPELGRERIDFEIGAGSLARFLRRSLAQFPRHGGYLRADPARVARWRERLEALGAGLKVGLSWEGGVRRTRRALRSLALEQCLPILAVPGVRFVSLQYTPEAPAQVAALERERGIRIEHWREAIDEYEETAALATALDLVVSVCTAVVHLAGALGRPVWVMAPFSPEWRYGFSGGTMPWYPSVRVFRQPAYGRWDPVIEAVAAALGSRARGES
jgi:tetratricopeptide (TPR) repeat protein